MSRCLRRTGFFSPGKRQPPLLVLTYHRAKAYLNGQMGALPGHPRRVGPRREHRMVLRCYRNSQHTRSKGDIVMFDFRRAFGACVAIGMLAGCGGSQPMTGAPSTGVQAATRSPERSLRGYFWLNSLLRSGIVFPSLLFAFGSSPPGVGLTRAVKALTERTLSRAKNYSHLPFGSRRQRSI